MCGEDLLLPINSKKPFYQVSLAIFTLFLFIFTGLEEYVGLPPAIIDSLICGQNEAYILLIVLKMRIIFFAHQEHTKIQC